MYQEIIDLIESGKVEEGLKLIKEHGYELSDFYMYISWALAEHFPDIKELMEECE